MVKLYTCNINFSKKLIANGVDKNFFIDTTVKSGIQLLAPSWDIVMGHKNGKYTDEQYTEQYLSMMRTKYRANKNAFHAIFDNKPEIYLMCYCKSFAFCHRTILADILIKLGYANDWLEITELNKEVPYDIL